MSTINKAPQISDLTQVQYNYLKANLHHRIGISYLKSENEKTYAIAKIIFQNCPNIALIHFSKNSIHSGWAERINSYFPLSPRNPDKPRTEEDGCWGEVYISREIDPNLNDKKLISAFSDHLIDNVTHLLISFDSKKTYENPLFEGTVDKCKFLFPNLKGYALQFGSF